MDTPSGRHTWLGRLPIARETAIAPPLPSIPKHSANKPTAV